MSTRFYNRKRSLRMNSCVRASLGLVLLFEVTVGVHLKGRLAKEERQRHVANADCSKTNCTTADADARRLWQADKADVEDFPYVAAVMRGGEVWCGAAIIRPNFLLTTANCFWLIKRPEKSMSIVYGISRSDQDHVQHKIESVMMHPLWKTPPHPPDHDIAVICLRQGIDFSPMVHDVELPRPEQIPLLRKVFVTGFGWHDEKDYTPRDRSLYRQLHSYVTDVQRYEDCEDKLAERDLVLTERFMCLRAAPHKAPCVKDTGAPAVSDGILWGLASWSVREECGDARWPVVFTSIAEKSNLDFIQLAMDQKIQLWKMEDNAQPSYV